MIGFCTQQYSRADWLGLRANSIGFNPNKWGIDIDQTFTPFDIGGELKEKDVIGIGVAHFPNSLIICFAVCNGELLGKRWKNSRLKF